MMTTVVVVGNAEPSSDYSEFIDNSDYVFRFNFTPFYETGKTGCLTTDLCLFGLPYPNAGEIPRLNTHIVKNCRSVWVESPTFLQPLMWGYGIPREKIILRHLHGVRDRYAIDGAERITAPSSGFQIVRYLVNESKFAACRKCICGFQWQGAENHLWDVEKKQAERYLDRGLLEMLV